MEIIVKSRPAPERMSSLSPDQEKPDVGQQQDPVLRALMSAGMSERTAREQVLRLSAGDIWSG